MKISEYTYLLGIIATLIPTGFSLKCFQCNSAENATCSDVVANDTASPFLKECDGLYDSHTPFCRKLSTRVLEGKNQAVVRSCGWIMGDKQGRKDFCKKGDTDFILRRSCVCFSEMCNTSQMNAFNVYLVLMLMLSIII